MGSFGAYLRGGFCVESNDGMDKNGQKWTKVDKNGQEGIALLELPLSSRG